MNRIAMSLLAVMLFAGCAETPPVTSGPAPSAEEANAPPQPIAAGTALPAGYKIDTARTIIFGTDENWTGRLSYTTSTSADEVFDFLHREMPNFGWAEVTAMRSDPSVMTFSSSATSRTATVTIARGAALGVTRVEMVVAPTGPGGAANR